MSVDETTSAPRATPRSFPWKSTIVVALGALLVTGAILGATRVPLGKLNFMAKVLRSSKGFIPLAVAGGSLMIVGIALIVCMNRTSLVQMQTATQNPVASHRKKSTPSEHEFRADHSADSPICPLINNYQGYMIKTMPGCLMQKHAKTMIDFNRRINTYSLNAMPQYFVKYPCHQTKAEWGKNEVMAFEISKCLDLNIVPQTWHFPDIIPESPVVSESNTVIQVAVTKVNSWGTEAGKKNWDYYRKVEYAKNVQVPFAPAHKALLFCLIVGHEDISGGRIENSVRTESGNIYLVDNEKIGHQLSKLVKSEDNIPWFGNNIHVKNVPFNTQMVKELLAKEGDLERVCSNENILNNFRQIKAAFLALEYERNTVTPSQLQKQLLKSS